MKLRYQKQGDGIYGKPHRVRRVCGTSLKYYFEDQSYEDFFKTILKNNHKV